jgi:5-methylcytosine-specific restriction endonuclease McrA
LDIPKVKNHTKVYLKAFGYDTNSWIACEVCGGTAVDIHHLNARGMGGSKIADTIENLMALCRPCHVAYGDIKEFKERLKATHNHHLSKRVI